MECNQPRSEFELGSSSVAGTIEPTSKDKPCTNLVILGYHNCNRLRVP